MKTVAISLLALMLGLTGCKKTGTQVSAAAAADPLETQLRKLAGDGAKNCGHISGTGDVKSPSDCAMQASAAKAPFYVAYDLPGGEAGMLTFAFAGSSNGRVYRVEYSPKGWPSQAPGGQLSDNNRTFTAECSAPLRLAQSGRVTCMPPMSGMGGMNPHGGMMGAPGMTNPHGGMTMPPPGTMNPHSDMAPGHGSNPPVKRN